MPHRPRRSKLILLLLAWLTLLAVAGSLLIMTELQRVERQFHQAAGTLANGVQHRLHANEAVLSGLSAFLLAVDRDDYAATERYAAAVTAAHDHIYQVEIARRIRPHDAPRLAEGLRRNWRGEFALKTFAELTGRTPATLPPGADYWPILFIHPPLPDTLPIFGLRLETVDHLASTLARAHVKGHAVASPMFDFYEGDTGYILLQVVERSTDDRRTGAPNFFGSTMASMLVIKSAALLPAGERAALGRQLGIQAVLIGSEGMEDTLLRQEMDAGTALDRRLLAMLEHHERIETAGQTIGLQFTRQPHLQDVLTPQTVAILTLLLVAALAASSLLLRHYRALKQAGIEHAHSAYLATHDVLTGLPNRYLLADRFASALHGWQRHGTRFAVILIDLDHFKDINDRYGHEAGDQVLCATGNRMSAQLRSCDTVARYGGDEFIVLLTTILDAGDALQVGNKLLAAISQPVHTSAGALPISCSVGVAICPDHGTDLDSLRRRADMAMYAAKQSGRHAIVLSADTTA